MSEDIKERLQKTSEDCLKSFEAWDKDRTDHGARETLMEAVHEMRKVMARLEIDMAISERDQMGGKPIPIPTHRSSKKRGRGSSGDKDGNRGPKKDVKKKSDKKDDEAA